MGTDLAAPPLERAAAGPVGVSSAAVLGGGLRVAKEGARRRGLALSSLKGRQRSVFVAVVVGLFAVAGVFAADRGPKPPPYALIIGTVWHANGQPAPGVAVKIRHVSDKNRHWELISNSQGEFAQRVPAGSADYIVAAKPKGRKKMPTETTVHIRNDERQDVSLRLLE
jgi:hypothetical protein